GKVEFHLRRDGRKETRHVHEPVGLDLRQQRQLGIERGDARKIDFVPAQRGENIAEPRCVVRRLEIRRPEVSKHRIVPGLVGLIERDQRRADENDHAVAVDLSGLRCAAAGLPSCATRTTAGLASSATCATAGLASSATCATAGSAPCVSAEFHTVYAAKPAARAAASAYTFSRIVAITTRKLRRRGRPRRPS